MRNDPGHNGREQYGGHIQPQWVSIKLKKRLDNDDGSLIKESVPAAKELMAEITKRRNALLSRTKRSMIYDWIITQYYTISIQSMLFFN